MRFLVTEKLGPHKFKTPEGYLICTDAILSRTGKQEYKRCEIFGDACDEPDKIVNVDRIDDEVFSDKAMASFENKPICIEHPDEDVNIENHNELSVGFMRDIHKGEDNGHPVMMGTLVITDKDAVEAVESGEYKELSCGYDCDIDDDDNPQQRNIRGNHVALCKHGRAGIARIVDSVKDVNDLTKFKMALRNISKMYSNDPGIEYVMSVLKNLGYEVTVDSIDGWRENKNVPGEHIKQYRMNVMLEGREHHFLVQLYADMGEWKVKEINAYMLDSINTNQGEYMKDEDFSKKTKQGFRVLEMYRDGGRLHVIFKRANDYGIGLGYDTTDGQWSQGRYDFSTLEKARQALVEEKPYARRIQDDMKDEDMYIQVDMTDKWGGVHSFIVKSKQVEEAKAKVEKRYPELKYKTSYQASESNVTWAKRRNLLIDDDDLLSVEEENYNKANKPVGAKDSKEQLFTVEYEQDGVTYIRKVKAITMQDAIEQVKSELTDARLSPMTYKRLKELGVTSQQWSNWTQEQASAYIARRKQNSNTSSNTKNTSSNAKNTSSTSLSKAAQRFANKSWSGEQFVKTGDLPLTRSEKIPYIDVKPSEIDAAKELLASKGLNKTTVVKEGGSTYLHVDKAEYQRYAESRPVKTSNIEQLYSATYSHNTGIDANVKQSGNNIVITFEKSRTNKPREISTNSGRVTITPEYEAKQALENLSAQYGKSRVKANGNKIVISNINGK